MMESRPVRRRSISAAAMAAAMLAATLVVMVGGQSPASASVSSVKGSACGFFVNVGLFGGPQSLKGCGSGLPTTDIGYSPKVTLPAGGSPGLTAADADGARAEYGPAAIFSGIWPLDQNSAPPSGPISVSTQGTTGAGGSVTSSADIVLRTPADPASPGGFGPGPVEGDELHVTCSANETSVSGSTTFANGILTTETDSTGAPLVTEPIPNNPPVNYTRSGVITNVGDVFTVVFNQHIVNSDGSLTVNAFHMYLFGPVAVGESVGGQVTCGTTPTTVTPNDTVSPTCGIPVVKPMGPDDPTPQVPRQELIGTFDAGGLNAITNQQIVNGTIKLGDPSSTFTYLKFVKGQKGPLPVTATRTNEALPMFWSFDAVDKAGHTTHCAGIVPGPTFLAVSDAVVTEGNAGTVNASFTVTRTGVTDDVSSVTYATVDGTAIAPGDYTAIPATTLNFAAGQTTKTVNVQVKGDTVDEANETFTLKLSAPTGASLTDKKAKGTIVDDEGAVTPGPTTFLTVNDVYISEGNSGTSVATITVTRSGNTSGTSTVKYATGGGTATAPGDYTAQPLTTLTFNAGQTTKTVNVPVVGDITKEPNETFMLNLSASTGADITDTAGTTTIINND